MRFRTLKEVREGVYALAEKNGFKRWWARMDDKEQILKFQNMITKALHKFGVSQSLELRLLHADIIWEDFVKHPSTH